MGVYDHIKLHLKASARAWDCGTGNGQVAARLSEFFHSVEATDISENQLKNAVKKSNIRYSLQPAEKSSFPSQCFDLITCGQAIHWFQFDYFYSEVKRCLKPEGIFVVLGYGLFRSNPDTNKVIDRFYDQIIGPYWDRERKYLEANYTNIPFPFKEIKTPNFQMEYHWDLEHLLGYLRTWSAVKHYQSDKGSDPVALIEEDLGRYFGRNNKVIFPVLFRMGMSPQE